MEFNELSNTNQNAQQIFDFTDATTTDHLSEIFENLSLKESVSAMAAIYKNTQNEYTSPKEQTFKSWFDIALLPILKNFATFTGSKLTIQQDSNNDITATLASRCGFDITSEQKQMHMVLAAASQISINKWTGSDMVELSFIFVLPQTEE